MAQPNDIKSILDLDNNKSKRKDQKVKDNKKRPGKC